MILYATLAFLGPVFGPLFSGFIQEDAGFRWNLRVMAIIATVTSIAVAFVPETHGPTLLKWKLEKEGHKPPKIPLSKFLSVYKTALSRPVLYLFTGELLL
jgi:DHA1 family multidrug resistance protein-like MFS transporter